jgi:hypothetical protein
MRGSYDQDKMKANKTSVRNWKEELKKRGITEFQFKDLPEDLKKMGMLRRASALGEIKEIKKIKDAIVWKVE